MGENAVLRPLYVLKSILYENQCPENRNKQDFTHPSHMRQVVLHPLNNKKQTEGNNSMTMNSEKEDCRILKSGLDVVMSAKNARGKVSHDDLYHLGEEVEKLWEVTKDSDVSPTAAYKECVRQIAARHFPDKKIGVDHCDSAEYNAAGEVAVIHIYKEKCGIELK